MGIFYKIKIGFVRMCKPSIPHTSSAKRYGNIGENDFANSIKSLLPDAQIKKNILITTPEGNAEIDCLILYKNKLFAVEVKRWKGNLTQHNGDFIQEKVDRWTGEIHTNRHKSPFKQLGRAIYLLKKQIPQKAWINPVVFFDEAVSVCAEDESVWFLDMNELTKYITSEGAPTPKGADIFFEKCIAADTLYSKKWGRSLSCFICDDSLMFKSPKGLLTRNEISSVKIRHHWSYDELFIRTNDGALYTTTSETASITVMDNGRRYSYALCKLDEICLG